MHSRCESKIRQLSSAPGNFFAATTQQPAAAGNKKQRRFVRTMANLPPAPGGEDRYCHVIPNSGKWFLRNYLALRACLSFEAQKTP
jgi:hypothetical protein